jgi:hypothetical protein
MRENFVEGAKLVDLEYKTSPGAPGCESAIRHVLMQLYCPPRALFISGQAKAGVVVLGPVD